MIGGVIVADWGKLRLVSRWRGGAKRCVSLTRSFHSAQWFAIDKAREVKAHMEGEGREVKLFNSVTTWLGAKNREETRRKEEEAE